MSTVQSLRGGWKEVIKNHVQALISKSSLSQRTFVISAFYDYKLSVQNWSGDVAVARRVV